MPPETGGAHAAPEASVGPLVDIPTNVKGGIRQAYGSGRLLGDASFGCLWLKSDMGILYVIWPKGYTARLQPVELISDDGEVVAREGDFLEGSVGYSPPVDFPECGVEFEGAMVMGRLETVNGTSMVHPDPSDFR